MKKTYSVSANIAKGGNQFIDEFIFEISDNKGLRCTLRGGILDWNAAKSLSCHPIWIKRSSPLLEEHYHSVFDCNSKVISFNKNMSELILFNDPVIYVSSLSAEDSAPSELNIFLNIFIKYFEDKTSICLFPNWRSVGNKFSLLGSEVIEVFNTLGVCIENKNLAVRFMESRKKIEQSMNEELDKINNPI